MKKLMAIVVAVALVITLFAVVIPVGAQGPPLASERTVYESAIIPTGWGTDSLDEGEVKVFADGSVIVKIEGAEPDRIYYVCFGQSTSTWTLDWVEIGSFTTDENGNQVFTATITGPVLAPVFAINYPRATLTQFVSGFEIE